MDTPARFVSLPFAVAVACAIAALAAGCSDDDTVEPGALAGDEAARVARAAVFIGSCVPDDGVQRTLSGSYDRIRVPGHEVIKLSEWAPCFAAAADGCGAVERCAGISFDTTGPCTPSCVGNRLTVCDDARKFVFDCPAETVCVDGQGCQNMGPACDYDTFDPRCDDGTPINCDEGERPGPACGDYGLTCAVDAGLALCTGLGEACTPDSYATNSVIVREGTCADGRTLSACIGLSMGQVDCQRVRAGLGCHTLAGKGFCGLAAECDPNEGDAVCDGNVLTVCNAGRTERIDCAALGFSSCGAGFNGDVCKM